MAHTIKTLFILLQLFAISWTLSQPYCHKNVTEVTYKMVTKTRIKSVSSKNFFKKILSKKDTQIEVYEDQEPVYKIKLERICCEGFKLSEYNLCEPQCGENGCPQHSRCVDPEVCECKSGYFSKRSAQNGKLYCEPICVEPCPEHSECVGPNQCTCKKGYHNKHQLCTPYCASGCPYGGLCAAPNICSCQEGYKSEKGSCLPICSLGDQCQNGRCIAQDYCICNHGFSWNNETLICEEYDIQSSTYYPDLTESQQHTDLYVEVETDIDTSNDDIDPNQVFDENVETTTLYINDEYGSSTLSPVEAKHKCPDDYVFHKGQCRPLKFVSNENDCWTKPCEDKNAVCLENGICACNEGYKLFKMLVSNHNSTNQTVATSCLSLEVYKAKQHHLEEDNQKNATEEPTHWTSILFSIVGILTLTSALIFLAVKLFSKKTGELDVEGKNLACTYDNRAESEKEKSII